MSQFNLPNPKSRYLPPILVILNIFYNLSSHAIVMRRLHLNITGIGSVIVHFSGIKNNGFGTIMDHFGQFFPSLYPCLYIEGAERELNQHCDCKYSTRGAPDPWKLHQSRSLSHYLSPPPPPFHPHPKGLNLNDRMNARIQLGDAYEPG